LGKKWLSQRSRIESLFGIHRYYRHSLWVILVYLLDWLIDKQNGLNTRKAPWNR
jgi:hypothetical protein